MVGTAAIRAGDPEKEKRRQDRWKIYPTPLCTPGVWIQGERQTRLSILRADGQQSAVWVGRLPGGAKLAQRET